MSDEDAVAKYIEVGPSGGDICLSVRQPYASMIVAQYKPFENRTWTTSYRGPVWIHASKIEKDFWTKEMEELLGIRPIDLKVLKDDAETTGAIIGCAWLDMVYPKELLPRKYTGNVHAEGPFCWHFTAADSLDTPVKYKGALSLFKFKP